MRRKSQTCPSKFCKTFGHLRVAPVLHVVAIAGSELQLHGLQGAGDGAAAADLQLVLRLRRPRAPPLLGRALAQKQQVSALPMGRFHSSRRRRHRSPPGSAALRSPRSSDKGASGTGSPGLSMPGQPCPPGRPPRAGTRDRRHAGSAPLLPPTS